MDPGKIVSVRFWILDRISFSIRISFLGEPVAGAVEPLGRDSIAVVFPLSPVLLGGVVAAIVFMALIIALGRTKISPALVGLSAKMLVGLVMGTS